MQSSVAATLFIFFQHFGVVAADEGWLISTEWFNVSNWQFTASSVVAAFWWVLMSNDNIITLYTCAFIAIRRLLLRPPHLLQSFTLLALTRVQDICHCPWVHVCIYIYVHINLRSLLFLCTVVDQCTTWTTAGKIFSPLSFKATLEWDSNVAIQLSSVFGLYPPTNLSMQSHTWAFSSSFSSSYSTSHMAVCVSWERDMMVSSWWMTWDSVLPAHATCLCRLFLLEPSPFELPLGHRTII